MGGLQAEYYDRIAGSSSTSALTLDLGAVGICSSYLHVQVWPDLAMKGKTGPAWQTILQGQGAIAPNS